MALRGSVATVISAPPGDVFRFVTDIDRLPEWNARMTRIVEPLVDLAPEHEWVVELRWMANTWRSRSRVLAYDAASHHFSHRSRTDDGNPSYADWAWDVTLDDDDSRVSVSWELQPRSFWRRALMARIRNRVLRDEVRRSLCVLEEHLTRSPEPR